MMDFNEKVKIFEKAGYSSIEEHLSESDRTIFQVLELTDAVSKALPENEPIHIDLEYDVEECYHFFTVYLEEKLDNYQTIKYMIEDYFNYVYLSVETKKDIFSYFEPFTFFNNTNGIELLKKGLLGGERYSWYQANKLDSDLSKKEQLSVKLKI